MFFCPRYVFFSLIHYLFPYFLFISNSDIIGRIPELSTMLLMLMADSETLVEWSHGDWTAMATALFLYKYPPPCSRNVIDRVVNEAMNLIPLNDIQIQHPDELVRFVLFSFTFFF